MADYMALFHNPESFSDSDLSSMRNKIRLHKMFLLTTTVGFMAIPFLMGKPHLAQRTAGFGLVGLAFGNFFSNDLLGNSRVNASKYSQGV